MNGADGAVVSTPSLRGIAATGDGEMADRVRLYDWSNTPLGPSDQWPQSLRTVVNILLSSRYAMWMAWGPELTFLCNDAYLPTLGIKQPWALGSRADKVWEEIWSDIGPRIESVLSTGKATYDEGLMLVLERSGFPEETYHTFSYSPLTDDSGSLNGMLCVVTEETDRVIGERRVETLRDVASALAAVTTEEEVLRTLGLQLGRNPKDLPFTLIYLFDDAGNARLACSSGIAQGHPLAPEHISHDADFPWPVRDVYLHAGSRVLKDLSEQRNIASLPAGDWNKPVDDVVVVTLKQQGQEGPAGFLVVGRNPYRHYDASYSGFVDLLSGQISAGLANVRAHEAERRRAQALAEIDRAKTAFFSNVSHEFRTPLTLILGPIEEMLARAKETFSGKREELELVYRNGLRLQKLVNALLDFSRIEAGRAQASFESTDLAEMTADIASTFRSAMEKAGLAFVIDCQPLSQPVYLDREMWEKIVLNLLSNAFKFTFEGWVRIGLKEMDGKAVCFVEDTGTGIPETELPHIFERFHRVENARGRTFEGTGIGLALVAELVKLHGGHVSVQSTDGKGSIFRVELPFGEAHLPKDRIGAARSLRSTAQTAGAYLDEALQWLPEHTPVQAPAPRLEGRVLLADDNADMRDYVRRILSPTYEVEAVSNGAQALAAVQRQGPDLILSDVMMPELSGIELVKALRASPQTARIPIILLSARSGEEARLEGIDSGADDYLAKPFSGRELMARIGAHLKLARARQEAEAQTFELNRRLRDRVGELETLLTVIPVGIGIATDPHCRNIQVNSALSRLLEVSIDQNASLTRPETERPTHFRVVGDDGKEIPDTELPMQVSAREGKEIRDLELNLVFEGGRAVRLLEYAAPLFDEHGASRGCVAAFVDITERRRAEARNRFLVALDDATRPLADPDEIALTAARLLGEHLKVDRAAYVTADADEDSVTVVADYSPHLPSMVGRYRLSDFSNDMAQTLKRNESFQETDVEREGLSAAEKERYQRLKIRSHVTVPLHKEGRLVATIAINQATPRYWSADEIDLVKLVANRCWESIERGRVVRALRESEQRLAIAQSAGRVGTFDWNIQTNAVVWTEQEEQLFGLEPGAFEGSLDGWWQRVVPEDLAKLKTLFAGCWLHRREDISFEFRIVWPDGSTRHIGGGGRFFYDESGAPLRLVGVNVDLTEQRVAEQASRESEERFRSMADNIAQLAWMTDAAGWIFWYNQQWFEYTGTTLEEMQGWGWQTVHHPDHRERVVARFRTCIEAGEIWEDTFPLRGRNGEWRWFLSRARPIRDDQGKIVRWFGTNTDITEQREVEKELRRANSDLEQFAYSASHDLKEPLRNVSIYSGLLARRYAPVLDGQGLQFLSFVKEGASRMESLIGDLLAYTQIRNTDETPAVDIDGQSVFETALKTLGESIREANARVEAAALPPLRMHEAHLLQLFQNLIGNAIKYRADDPPVVHVNAEPKDGHWLISVTDNGIGIHPDYHQSVFGIFKRLHGRDKYSGTGIGLAICQRIVERYGGRIWVESALGHGSTFFFTVPTNKITEPRL